MNENDFQLSRCGEDYYLLNQRHDGTYEMFDKLVSHGGPGETLEMSSLRMTLESQIEESIAAARLRAENDVVATSGTRSSSARSFPSSSTECGPIVCYRRNAPLGRGGTIPSMEVSGEPGPDLALRCRMFGFGAIAVFDAEADFGDARGGNVEGVVGAEGAGNADDSRRVTGQDKRIGREISRVLRAEDAKANPYRERAEEQGAKTATRSRATAAPISVPTTR